MTAAKKQKKGDSALKETKVGKKHKPEEAKEKAEQAVVNIGMVGHVDHGKTSLTQALTGKWTDTHSEELKRGISIRLGYADASFFKCKACKGSQAYSNKPVCPTCGKKAEKLRRVSFVDAPGHETLMTTMLSGAALMHGAVLVIAANEECPQPQTEEHLMALKIAGISSIVVAQNKIDLVDKKKAIDNKEQILKFLEKNGYRDAPIIPIAANFSTNIDMLIEAIEKHIPTPKFEPGKKLLMYCARSFDINKPGAKPAEMKGGIVGGSIIQGKAEIGDKIVISPGITGKILETTIKSVSSTTGELKEAAAGGLIAIRTMIDPSLAQNDRLRGQVIAQEGFLPEPIDHLEIELNYIERLVEKLESRVKTNDKVVLTVGTMTLLGTAESSQGNRAKISLNGKVVVMPKQKIAISKMEKGRWRLVAYATG
ncbi:MAG: translation initiation factor IF-2 subunit gamma [Candidatus Diapherotrites archaeon]|uniref:protein-synthesizing GTPase n=1 Tax=Candidatus Iainarchaeum sp. TaxID=3101447 RepID=A0A939C7H6_9ARCH|nr:translation initiation factor IF-2 subunit gamma [Candidatus Diapherotrites archaeon]